ncbi:MAG: thiolase family protein [Dehalococcoidia bacterium]|nr:thiolase family protein [Dehalococcoidia bacterium]
MERAAVIGVGQTKYERKKEGVFAELVYEATTKALDDAGMKIEDIDNVVTISNDFWDGRTISCMAVADAAGCYGKDGTTVECDGAFGAFYGLMRTLSGYDTTLVVAHSKVSEGKPRSIFNAAFDPLYERILGLDAVSSSALQARAYMKRFGVTEEQCALVSVKNHNNAKNNPYAQVPLDIAVDDVMKSTKLADPIKFLDTSPISDGACAIIFATEKKAKKWGKKPIWVKGVAHCTDAYHLGERDLTYSEPLERAAQKAYQMAGISNPLGEIDVAEVYDAFSYMELMWYEALGFCGKGEGGKLIESGKTNMGGELPVNPSGGVLSAHSVLVAGLARIAEAVLQLRGEAGKRQAPEAKIALAHGINGICAQQHCVWILGSEK